MTLNYNTRQHIEAGAAAYIRQDYKKSAALFSRAIKTDRGFAPAYVYRGSAYLRSGQLTAAMADFERAIQLDPDFALAYHLRALVHEKQGNFAQAYRDFDSALHIDPYFSSAYCGRDSILSGQTADACNEDAEIINHLNSVRLQSRPN
jgi:tetratricopeptide (TPR) repeat protein